MHDDWDSFHDFFRKQGRGRLIAFSKFSDVSYTAPGTYQPGDWLLFGAETTGLPPEVSSLDIRDLKILCAAWTFMQRGFCPDIKRRLNMGHVMISLISLSAACRHMQLRQQS